MSKKKMTAAASGNEGNPVPAGAGEKLKTKAPAIEGDDVYSVGTEVSQEKFALTGKKGRKGISIDEIPQFGFGGKKGKAKKGEEGQDGPVVSFSGKKRSLKSTRETETGSSLFTGSVFDVLAENEIEVVDEGNYEDTGVVYGSKVNESKEVPETSKSRKKKKNKGGRTGLEEDELDKMIQLVQVQHEIVIPVDGAGEKEGGEEVVESAAVKKKKKKKKKVVAAAAVGTSTASLDVKDENQEKTRLGLTEAKGKAADKKVPKHIREMQEAVARRNEQGERMREEEERLKLEEEERQREEAKRKKKEREKEKLQKKREEGKLLTAKQKEENRWLAAMKNQIFANAPGGLPLTATDSEKPAKRPLYKKKKSKVAPDHANGSASEKPVENMEVVDQNQHDIVPAELDSVEFDKVDQKVESMANIEQKSEVAESVKENRVEDDDDDWEAKSWDDAVVNLSFKHSDEGIDSDPELVVKKDIKSASTNPAVSGQKAVLTHPLSSRRDVEIKKKQPETDVESSRKKNAAGKNEATSSDSAPKESKDNLRSPICCIMGHVDAGKTKLLDCIRGTKVQVGEAGGITQQIGATYIPAETIRERTKELKADAKLKVPGLLVLDTPGHESFANLRSRGSGLCDIAILIVDIKRGLEPQTIESLNLLKKRNTQFIVALNKVDRLYGWKTCRNSPIVKAMKKQSKDVQNELNRLVIQVITQFKEQGLNTELYYKNKEMGETYNIVPTSAISGEGIPDLLLLLVHWAQKTMVEKLTFSNEIQCTVLEVNVIDGLGTTIDVILVNGMLHEGDQIVACSMQEPIVTRIRALKTPYPMKEIRVKGEYMGHPEIKAAQGVKIVAPGLEHAIAGTALYVVGPDDDVDKVKDVAMEDMKSVLCRIDKSGKGVCVQASTLGSLEALLELLKTPDVNIPVSGIGIGPVHKKDVMKASAMLEKKKEFASILAFDVQVAPEAQERANELGVQVMTADVIYHLFNQFKAYIDNLKEQKKKEYADQAVFPCVLKILPDHVIKKSDPIILGVEVLEGVAKVGCPICIPSKNFITIGRIGSIEINRKRVDVAEKGMEVAIMIESVGKQKIFGRHFNEDDELVSQITRSSIDVLKANYQDELSKEDWKLVAMLKKIFKIT